jgi:hypothetical protein
VQLKEIPLEPFFHQIVMNRINLRVLEQKVNASDKLTDADKVDLQQYITRCYGSLTTFQYPIQEQRGSIFLRIQTSVNGSLSDRRRARSLGAFSLAKEDQVG